MELKMQSMENYCIKHEEMKNLIFQMDKVSDGLRKVKNDNFETNYTKKDIMVVEGRTLI